jgi:hypothetical protein
MTLQEAWEERKKIWAKGTRLIEDGNILWKEIATMPASGAVRVGVWFSLSEDSAQAAGMVFRGYENRVNADVIWHDALIENKGPKVKLTWVFDAEKKGYTCVLDSGEEFKA